MTQTNVASAKRTFEEALAQLEQIVRELEDGQVGLEEALARYEAGVSLLKECYAQLRDAEQRILLLTGTDDDGGPVTQPFAHAASVEVTKAEAKPRRKRPPEGDKLFNG